MKTALIAGATGLIGQQLVNLLLQDPQYETVERLVRKDDGLLDEKLKTIVVKFDELETLEVAEGADFYCALGTTMRTAGSKNAFKKVDYDYVLSFGKLAEKSKAANLIVVSSIGASSKTNNFYLKTKGEMERDVMNLDIPDIHIVRPSMLLGDRGEFRFGEKIGQIIMPLFSLFLIGKLKKYRAIEGKTVAKSMIYYASNKVSNKEIHESDELEKVASIKK